MLKAVMALSDVTIAKVPMPRDQTEDNPRGSPFSNAPAPDASLAPGWAEPPADELQLLEAAVDAAFYRSQVPWIDFSRITAAFHYATIGWRAGLDPTPNFSTAGYLTANRDVLAAGVNPLVHFTRQGKAERRTFTPPAWGRSIPADERASWQDYDYVRHRAAPDKEGSLPDPEALRFTTSLAGQDLAAAIALMRFTHDQTPPAPIKVSIIIPTLNEELALAECLASISKALPNSFAIEVIVADNASTDTAYAGIARHRQLRHLRFDQNLGFGPACNAAAEVASGEYLFFLNNDAQIAPGCIETLVSALENPQVGICGPKILSFDGRLQEAGCLLRPDATGDLIGFGKDPRTPRYNYQRAVEHVSGAAILIARALFADLGGFDPVYAPAYCEDADLSLKVRARGLSIIYAPKAVIAHHLSRTTSALAAPDARDSKRQRIARNRQTLINRWSDTLSTTDLRTLAFYLPQYHTVPQNDLWWGKGFTDWTNLARARPNFQGHNQPRIPADLGYYDLRNHQVMEQQAELARRYGITGFCYYYYNFSGERILETPLETMLATGRPDLPFCLCWANENWTRRWDGQDSDVLMRQTYADHDMVNIIDDIARHFRSKAYINVGGRPLILIYRLLELPDPRRAVQLWRNRCRETGVGEICVAMVESFELSAAPKNPVLYGCDFSVEFPAHGMVQDPARDVVRSNPAWTGSAHDYRELALAFMRRVDARFSKFRSVLVGWDTTPRHPDRSIVLENATPGAFQAWLEWTCRRTMEQNLGDSRIVFINAWNEWCEGSYLEPDQRHGHGHLQAVRNALENVEIGGSGFAFT